MSESLFAATLSIIIPVFNTEERYFRPCLASVEACSSVGIRPEVIVVDDGSDVSYGANLPEILAEYDLDVHFFRKANGGQNSARNLGITHACGDYLLFLDSDDRLVPSALAIALDAASFNRPDVLCFNFDRIDADGRLLAHCGPWRDGYRTSESFSGFISESDSLFRQLYCRESFVNTGLTLVEGPRIGEDMASAVVLLLSMGRVASIGVVPYLYVQRPTSALHTGASGHVFDILDSAFWMLDRLGRGIALYNGELESLCIEHVLFWGGVRCISCLGPDPRAKERIFDWMNERFPSWRRSACLTSLTEKHGVDFCLVVGGRWHLYAALLRLRALKRRILSVLAASSGGDYENSLRHEPDVRVRR